MRLRLRVLLLTLLPAGLSGLAAAQSLHLRAGAFFPAGDSEFWRDTRDQFTLEKSDLYGATAGAAYLQHFGSHLALGFDVSGYHGDTLVAERGLVDEYGYDIEHDVRLTVVPMMVDLRVFPLGSEEASHGSYGIRRRTIAPYLGAGLGGAFWRYEEEGDFVDRAAGGLIYYDRYVDDGFVLAGHVLAGIEIPLGEEWGLLLEGRYLWAEAEPGGDFAGLGKIDLSGPSVTLGVAVHF